MESLAKHKTCKTFERVYICICILKKKKNILILKY